MDKQSEPGLKINNDLHYLERGTQRARTEYIGGKWQSFKS